LRGGHGPSSISKVITKELHIKHTIDTDDVHPNGDHTKTHASVIADTIKSKKQNHAK
jgi:gluconate kinase